MTHTLNWKRARGMNDKGRECLEQIEHYTISGPVVYWMNRDQRVKDNWALLMAQYIAQRNNRPLHVVVHIPSDHQYTARQYDFMTKGLMETESELKKKHIPFSVFVGSTASYSKALSEQHVAGCVISDMMPLRHCVKRVQQVAASLSVPCIEVDAHNIVPVWIASSKQEFAARTIRPKIQKLLPEFLTEFPEVHLMPESNIKGYNAVHWKSIEAQCDINEDVIPVEWIVPGSHCAQKQLETFIEDRASRYDEKRNDPTQPFQSDLSPYLHMGQISAQRVALDVLASKHISGKGKEAFLEELIIRRELSDNYCFYNPHYDAVQGFPHWAQETLSAHAHDPRPHIYNTSILEKGQTHDDLWNAAQTQMVTTGKMHGYMRMYWAKKILEWTRTPEEACSIAIYLNDKYELDGNDPNGYVGIAWSLGGVHDRPWFTRPIFGTIRYMSYNGLKQKFDIETYINTYRSEI